MQKKLKASGNGWELYFSKPILKLLGYNPNEVKLLITSRSGILFIEPISIEDLDRFKNNMVRNLQKSGNSYGLYLPTPLLEIIDVNPETDYVNIDITDNKFTIKKSI